MISSTLFEPESPSTASVRPLRVAWVTSSPTPYKLPFFQRLSERPDLKLKFFFLTWKSASRPWEIEAGESLDYEVLPGFNLPTSLKEKRFLRLNPVIKQRLDPKQWDVVVISGYHHPTMWWAIQHCRKHRIPFVLQGESHVLKTRSAWKQKVKESLIFPAVRDAAAALATGTLAKRYWEQVGIPSDKIFIVGNVPEVGFFQEKSQEARFRVEATRQQLGLDPQRALGVFVGRFLRVKGVDILLEGLAKLPPAERPQLLLVGDGPEKEQLEAIVREHDLPVKMPGFLPNDELPALYAASDFFVLPSREEPWGVVVNEAAACGLPLLLSGKVGAAHDILQLGRNGLRVEPNTPKAWAEALGIAANWTASDVVRMGQHSRTIAAEWTHEASEREFMQAVRVAAAAQPSATTQGNG
ncbi:MAG: glycosyl transferase group 1 family [Puniceicoccaceae bacterium 5H]|nr:MAG: glycosyl transferase group 1 family [Puniceicoccaceae bacterium 5H]